MSAHSETSTPIDPDQIATDDVDSLPSLAVRGAVGGVLMGLANLVPGISGGTMLLATGVYPRFIQAIGEVTTLKFKRPSLIVLASVVIAAILAILLLAGTIKTLVVDHRWVMYALFIGLTLGGVPVVWRLIKIPQLPDTAAHENENNTPGNLRPVWIGALLGFVAMAALALFQSAGASGSSENSSFIFLLLAGIAGASAMILPGVSGGYLLLVLGVYVPILAGVDLFKEGLKAKDTAVILDVGLTVIMPVGLGVLVGVVGVSNLLRWLLKHHEKATLGVLLGLLVGAVVGLWPFQHTAEPIQGQIIKGQAITYGQPDASATNPTEPLWYFVESGEPIDAEDLPTAFFTPEPAQVGGALGLIVLGLGVTLLIDRVQSPSKKP